MVGLVVTLEAPSALSVGLCLAHMVTDKRAWLERLEVQATWPMSGKPRVIYVDNAAEFHSEALSAPDCGVPLTATIPLTLSCPGHGRRLENAGTVAVAAALGQPAPDRAATEPIPAMDRLTHQGMTTGTVTLPRRAVHVGVWFRLLRTLLDEVSTVKRSRTGRATPAVRFR